MGECHRILGGRDTHTPSFLPWVLKTWHPLVISWEFLCSVMVDLEAAELLDFCSLFQVGLCPAGRGTF